MNLFSGIHEVRLLRSDRRISVGYFESYEEEIRTVESEPDPFVVAWATLNPVIALPAGQALNPSVLRIASRTAGDEDILRRTVATVRTEKFPLH